MLLYHERFSISIEKRLKLSFFLSYIRNSIFLYLWSCLSLILSTDRLDITGINLRKNSYSNLLSKQRNDCITNNVTICFRKIIEESIFYIIVVFVYFMKKSTANTFLVDFHFNRIKYIQIIMLISLRLFERSLFFSFFFT